MNKKEISCYETDASRLIGKAEKVIFPESKEEVQQIIRSSVLDIVPRGAGSNLAGGCIPNNSIVVDVCKLNKVLDFNFSRKTVYVGAGITIKELNERLKKAGFEFPIIPLNNGISTIGGMIATNAVGCRSMKYGVMKDWIEEIEVVNGRGELIKIGKTDLMDICGMEGITGIIVSAILKISPLIKRSISVFQSEDLDEIFSIARRLRLEKEICMLQFISKEVSELLGFPKKYHIIIEFNSEKGKIKGEKYEELLKINDNIYKSLFSKEYYNNEDPKFFFDKIKEFILFLELKEVPYFGDLGLGIIHPFFKDNEELKRKEVNNVIKKTKIKFGKYGFGIKRKNSLDAFELKIINRVKLRYDPFGKLNRGKVLDTNTKGVQRRDILKSEIEKEEIKDIVKEEGIRISGEEKSARELLGELKTPEEKLEEFIKEVSKEEIEEKLDEDEEGFKEGLDEKRKDLFEKQVKDISDEELMIFDKNKETEEFEEFSGEVEDFWGEEEILDEYIGLRDGEIIPEPKSPPADYKMIQDIMTNKYGFEVSKEISDKPREKINDKKEEKKLDETKNIGETKNSELRGKLDKSEEDLINKIMLNKSKKEEKKEEKNDN